MSAAPTVKSGDLMKLGGSLRRVYQRRFFLLRGMQLYWFKKKGDVQHVGTLFVKTCMVTRFADKPKSFDIVTEEKTYSLKAKMKYEADEWVEALAFAGAQVTTSYSSVKDTSRALRRLTLSAKPQMSRKESSEEEISRVRKGRPQSNDKGRKESEKWFRRHHRTRSVSDTEVTLALRKARQLPRPTRHPRAIEEEEEEESPAPSEDESCSSSSMSDACAPQSPVHIQASFVTDFIQTPAVTVMPANHAPTMVAASAPTLPLDGPFSFHAGYMANIPQGVAPTFSPQQQQPSCPCTIGIRAPPGGMQMPVMQHTSTPVLWCMGEEAAVVENQFLSP